MSQPTWVEYVNMNKRQVQFFKQTVGLKTDVSEKFWKFQLQYNYNNYKGIISEYRIDISRDANSLSWYMEELVDVQMA